MKCVRRGECIILCDATNVYSSEVFDCSSFPTSLMHKIRKYQGCCLAIRAHSDGVPCHLQRLLIKRKTRTVRCDFACPVHLRRQFTAVPHTSPGKLGWTICDEQSASAPRRSGMGPLRPRVVHVLSLSDEEKTNKEKD
ncbi:hypothetical protein GJAV_G00273570 [Gymnothorax javanicus]|nr:hypothetical protein GJAV_G00273570 [Gymnothorax javanicus]